jgi:hypothetical protein
MKSKPGERTSRSYWKSPALSVRTRRLIGVDAGHRGVHQPDSPVLPEPIVAMYQRIVGAVAAQDFVGRWAGDELLVALDERHFDGAVAPFAQVFGSGSATEAGADDDDAPELLAWLAGNGSEAAAGNAGSAAASAVVEAPNACSRRRRSGLKRDMSGLLISAWQSIRQVRRFLRRYSPGRVGA